MPPVAVLPSDATDFPWIGYIESKFPYPTRGPSGLEIGTGTLIAPRLVLTAGHVLYDPRQGGQAEYVDVWFGGPWGPHAVRSAVVDFPLEWRHPRSALDSSLLSPVDIGVIILEEPVDRLIMPMPFQTASDAMLAGMSMNVLGYPALPPAGPRGTIWGRNFNLLRNTSYAWYEGFRLFYPVATLAGMSGGPVYDIDRGSGMRTIRGIHTSLIDGLGGSALRIEEGIYDLLLQWVAIYRP